MCIRDRRSTASRNSGSASATATPGPSSCGALPAGRIPVSYTHLREDFEEFLTRVDRMGYPHVDETDNPAYKMFLGWHHDD